MFRSLHIPAFVALASAALFGCGQPADDGKPAGDPSSPEVAPKRELPEGTSEGPGLTRRAMDQREIDALVEAGSDVAKPHRIEHQFTLENRDKAAKVAEWGTENGYEAVRGEADGEERPYYTVDLVKQAPLDIEAISTTTRLMETLAMQVDGEYDGWGCPVVVK